jgi:hypothetical protein
MFAAEIAAELDRSYQLIGKRGKTLAERDLVARKEVDNRRSFEMTKLAEKTYFADEPASGLTIDEYTVVGSNVMSGWSLHIGVISRPGSRNDPPQVRSRDSPRSRVAVVSFLKSATSGPDGGKNLRRRERQL